MRYVFFFVSLICTLPSIGQAYQGEGLNTVFLSTAKLNSFEGVSDQLHGLIDVDKNLVDFYVDLNTLDTGIKLRDKHMRDDYLETKKHPFAEFTGSFSDEDLEQIKRKQSGTYIIKGSFEVHGVALPREFELQLNFENNQKVSFETIFEIKLTDHDIEIPKLMFYELSNTLKITSNGELKLKK